MRRKYAFLIIANRNFDQLQQLIGCLDDERNDIYLLIDKTSREPRREFIVKKSKLIVIPEIPIYWGDYSQIQAELNLFKAAASNNYGYYHLLSGLDLPLACQDDIHAFFDNHPNKQFITYSSMAKQRDLRARLGKHVLTRHYRIDSSRFVKTAMKVFRLAEKYFLLLKNGSNYNDEIKYGSNWVTLDDSFIHDIIDPDNLKDVRKMFRGGYLVDELFIPYEITKLGYSNTIYYEYPVHDEKWEFQGNTRFINWWDGSPYVWRSKDFLQLRDAKMNGHFFSRKFDAQVDQKIIDMVINNLVNGA